MEEFFMKATGIVRRIDDLGRIVIPKEIRRTMRIKEGTPLEIFTDREGEIILKKYSPMGELSIFAREYAQALCQTTGFLVCITDRDQVVAASGEHAREFNGKEISRELDFLIENREQIQADYKEGKRIKVIQEQERESYAQLILPIISGGDAIGAVVLMGQKERDKMGETEKKLVQTAVGFLGRQMEQ
jgi:AbrB family transcriptional regulator (stage V sporulation protein T)